MAQTEPTGAEARTARHLIADYARWAGIDPDDLVGRTRTQAINLHRRAVWTLLYDRHGMTQTTIAALFDRDHTTIGHGITEHRRHVERHRTAAARTAQAHVDAARRKAAA